MMKLAGDHMDGPDYFKRFIENISNSAYWSNFVKLITETLLRIVFTFLFCDWLIIYMSHK